MVNVTSMTAAQASEAAQELDELANLLGMPNAERCSILGLSRDAYRYWHDGDVNAAAPVAPELIRRLNYALPLMRRMAANTPMAALGYSQNWPSPTVIN